MTIKSAVIAAGGKGTRLQSVNGEIPKALTKINDTAILEFQISQLLDYGVTEIHLLLGYKGDDIFRFITQLEKFERISFKFHHEKYPLGSGGALLEHRKQLPDEYFFIYCDILFDLNLEKFAEYHKRKQADITLLVHPNDHPYDSDLLEVDINNRVTKLHAHPHTSETFPGNLVNAAMYIVKNQVLTILPQRGKNIDFAQHLLPDIMNKKEHNIYSYKSHEFAKDIGTPERLEGSTRKIVNNISQNKLNKPVIFLDRDGTINEINQGEYITNPEQIKLIAGAANAIKRIRDLGYYVMVITNQPVIARGEVDAKKLKEIHNRLEWELGLEGAYVDEIYYCPHHPDKGYKNEISELKINCECRKPGTLLLEMAENYIDIDKKVSWFVGDSQVDVDCGQSYGIQTCLITPDNALGDVQATMYKTSLADFASFLEKKEN